MYVTLNPTVFQTQKHEAASVGGQMLRSGASGRGPGWLVGGTEASRRKQRRRDRRERSREVAVLGGLGPSLLSAGLETPRPPQARVSRLPGAGAPARSVS